MARRPSNETTMAPESSEGGGAGGVAGIGRGVLFPVLGATEEGRGAATPVDDADTAAVDEAPTTDGVAVHAARGDV